VSLAYSLGNNSEIGKTSGEILFAHYGITGNAVFELSYLTALYKNIYFLVDLVPKLNAKELHKTLYKLRQNLSHLTAGQFISGITHKKIGEHICKISGIRNLNVKALDITDAQLNLILHNLKKYKINILETTGFEHAQITAGGILTSEIDDKTMESKLAKDLYIVGETLDVFGLCGGYNLHWAWASGFLAGSDCAK